MAKENAKPTRSRLNLVTDACGFIGSHLVKKLPADGQKVVATDISGAFSHPNCKVIPANLTDKSGLKKLFKLPITHVFHTASPDDYSAPMGLLKKINIDRARNQFDIAVKHKSQKRFIHWSTCGAFGKPHTARERNMCNIP